MGEVEGADKLKLISDCVHFSDISNLAKRWEIGFKWSELLFQEFFHQGDLEREQGLPIGFLMDRYTTNIAANQVGFIDSFVQPCFEALYLILPNLAKNIENIKAAKEKWKSLEGHYEQKMKEEEKKKASLSLN